ncbi:t-box transcription factor TBX20 [Nephila pilipes]|uniref:T-box transcription factor TBX20 n=1 Tax=Nephila pilipes TaxID=299642 RepID=A0A8X6Q7F4_NEPPI|nr:t-box transcription factor TBX20 [Nephila pilipes]
MVAPASRAQFMVDTGDLVKQLSARAKDFSIDSLISRSQQMPYSDDSCNESCCSEEPLLSPPLLSPLEKLVERTTSPGQLIQTVSRAEELPQGQKKEPPSPKESPEKSENRKSPCKQPKDPRLLPKCNCEELQRVEAILETKDLWEKFYELGTEMIITKTGR